MLGIENMREREIRWGEERESVKEWEEEGDFEEVKQERERIGRGREKTVARNKEHKEVERRRSEEER